MDKALGYLGLAARAGRLVIGAEDCAKELRRHKGGLVIAAADAAEGTLEQIRHLCAGCGVEMLATAYTKECLGHAMGRGGPVALAYICDDGLARAFAAAAGSDREQEERE